jgi:uroporphyrinogen-III synthase
MRLLVLRPEPAASETAARLQALGHHVLVEPMLAVELGREPSVLPDPAAILFTSRNAVRAVAGWRQAAACRGLRAFAVGKETAAFARATGFADVRAGSGDASALADLVAAELSPSDGTLLYPAARDRAGDLEGLLAARGFSVHVVEAYRAIPAERLDEATAASLADGAIDGVLVYSRRTAATFVELARAAGLEKLPEVAFYVVSAAVAEPLRALAPAAIHIAARPDDLLALIPRAD